MPPLELAVFVGALHESNVRLRFWLESLIPDFTTTDTQPRFVTAQKMAGLLSELMRVGQWVRANSHANHAELDEEMEEYRKNVERLRALLPTIHAALLRERARLEQERARVESAAEWASRSRQTL